MNSIWEAEEYESAYSSEHGPDCQAYQTIVSSFRL